MPVALLKITQGANTDLAGRALRTDVGGPDEDTAVVFSNSDDTGVASWTYELLYQPPGSALAPTSQGPNVTPDFTIGPGPYVPGSYRVRLTVTDANGAQDVDIRNFVVPFPNGLIAPPYGFPKPLPLVGTGAKPHEMNVGDQPHGWDGNDNDGLLYEALRRIGTSSIPANIRYVDASNPAVTPDGSEVSPFTTVTAGLTALQDLGGGTLIVNPSFDHSGESTFVLTGAIFEDHMASIPSYVVKNWSHHVVSQTAEAGIVSTRAKLPPISTRYLLSLTIEGCSGTVEVGEPTATGSTFAFADLRLDNSIVSVSVVVADPTPVNSVQVTGRQSNISFVSAVADTRANFDLADCYVVGGVNGISECYARGTLFSGGLFFNPTGTLSPLTMVDCRFGTSPEVQWDIGTNEGFLYMDALTNYRWKNAIAPGVATNATTVILNDDAP